MELQIHCLRAKMDNLKVQGPNWGFGNSLGMKMAILPFFPLAFTLFLADHHLERRTHTLLCRLIHSPNFLDRFVAWFTLPVFSWFAPNLAFANNSIAPLQLIIRCPQSSSILEHIGHIVSFVTLLLALFLRTAKLLCAKHQINIPSPDFVWSDNFQILFVKIFLLLAICDRTRHISCFFHAFFFAATLYAVGVCCNNLTRPGVIR